MNRLFKKNVRVLSILTVLILLFTSLLVFTAYAQDNSKYEKILLKRFEKIFSQPSKVEEWAQGIRTDYGAKLDHLGYSVKIEFVAEDNTNTLIGATLTIKAYCLKNGKKMSLVQERAAFCLLNSSDEIIDAKVLNSTSSGLLPGWDGVEI